MVSLATNKAAEATQTAFCVAFPVSTTAQQQAIVAFEMGLSTAQSFDFLAGDLTSRGVQGGPQAVSQQNFLIRINDPVGLDPTNPIPFRSGTDFHNRVSANRLSEERPREPALLSQGILENTHAADGCWLGF